MSTPPRNSNGGSGRRPPRRRSSDAPYDGQGPMPPPDEDDIECAEIFCSFCGGTEREVGRIVRGPGGANICEHCLALCAEILGNQMVPAEGKGGNEKAVRKWVEKLKIPSPREIKAFLDLYIVGQDDTKKALAVAVHNHYRRITDAELGKKANPAYDDVEVEKSNILLIGPTGSGKTLFARTLARMLDVPFAIADATTITEAGYVGDDVENILLNLIRAADMDIARAERGIVYVDEIDKIARKTENVSITRDVSGEGVQQGLLKILEGTISSVPPQGGRKHPQQETLKIDTRNILFICGGAFVGLDTIVKQRAGRKTVGYVDSNVVGDEDARIAADELRVEPEDLVRYGLIPEFTGRLPVICSLNELTEDDLVRILTEPKNCVVKQYQKLLDLDGVKVSFTEDALREMARGAIRRKTGARGLRAIMEKLMMELMYEAPGRKDLPEIVITGDMVREQLRHPGALLATLEK